MSFDPRNPFFAMTAKAAKEHLASNNLHAERMEYAVGEHPGTVSVIGYDADDHVLFRIHLTAVPSDLRAYQLTYIRHHTLVADTVELGSLLRLMDRDNPLFTNANVANAPTIDELLPAGTDYSWVAAQNWFEMTVVGQKIHLTPASGVPSILLSGQLTFNLLPSEKLEHETIMLLRGPGFHSELLPAITPPAGIVYLNYQGGTGEASLHGAITTPAQRLTAPARYMVCSADRDGGDSCAMHVIEPDQGYLIIRAEGRSEPYTVRLVGDNFDQPLAFVNPDADGKSTTIVTANLAGAIAIGFEGVGGAFPVTIEHVHGSYLTSVDADEPITVDAHGRIQIPGEEALLFEQTFDTTAGLLCQMTIGTEVPEGEFDSELLGMYSDHAYLMLQYTGGQYVLSVTDVPDGSPDRLNVTMRITAPFGQSERLAFGIDAGNNLWMEYHGSDDAIRSDFRQLSYVEARRTRVNLELSGQQPFHVKSLCFVNRAAPWS